MKINKIDAYMSYVKNYNSYVQYTKNNKKNNIDYENAILISIFDQSYKYVKLINNMLYLLKNDILYKVDMSSCSPVRIATLINYLKDE